MIVDIKDENIEQKLHSLFGFESFRPGQKEIVDATLKGKDLFAVMPTGGGKSLCYQLPATILPGMAIVVSPLISLMKDQVDGAKSIGIKAEYLNSSLSNNQRDEILERIHNQELDLLYIAPERFSQPGFMESLKEINLSLFAIDEAHCISEWGHDFRPEYLQLSNLVDLFPNVPVIAFTATATNQVQNDIISRLRLRSPFLHRASFDRPNLFIEVIPKKRINDQIIQFIKNRPNESGIIYRTSRKSVEETTTALQEAGISAKPYHAGLDDLVRQKNQEAFNRDEISVIVATIAFGMGIDKSNVRYVIHGDLPKNMEGYYQEIGRAGRDGEDAHCTLFFGRGDIPKQRYFIDQVENENERKRLLNILNKMASYATIHDCRRKQLLAYFNEKYLKENCQTCDICTGTAEKTDVSIEAQKFLSAIIRSGSRFGTGYIIDILMGSGVKKIKDRGHDTLSCFGIGTDHDRSFWLSLADTLIAKGAIIQSGDQYPTLQCSESSRSILQNNEKVYMIVTEASKSTRKRKSSGGGSTNPELFGELRQLRRGIAESQKVPPYVIFSDATLREMSDLIPETENDLLSISGVGEVKLEKYGDQFLESIKGWYQKNQDAKRAELLNESKIKKTPKLAPGETIKFTRDLFLQGNSIKEIAEKRDLSPSTIESHIARAIESGDALDITSIITNDKVNDIISLSRSLNSEKLKDIVEGYSGEVTYGEVRIALATMKNLPN